MNIDLGNSTRADIISGVLGQLADGLWENSSMNKYYEYATIDGNELVVHTNTFKSGFYNKSEDWIKNWFANKLKKIVQEEHGNNKEGWLRMNTAICEYIGNDIDVSMCYECYDFLKGRHGHTYGFSSSVVLSGVDKFKNFLTNEIINYIKDCDFEITSWLNDWVDSIVKFFTNNYESLSRDIKTLEYMRGPTRVELYDLNWPNETECKVILYRALKNDMPYYKTITEELEYPMTPDYCFKAEYVCKGGIRDLVFTAVEKYFAENKEE